MRFEQLVETMMLADMELLKVRPAHERLTVFAGNAQDTDQDANQATRQRRAAAPTNPTPQESTRRRLAV